MQTEKMAKDTLKSTVNQAEEKMDEGATEKVGAAASEGNKGGEEKKKGAGFAGHDAGLIEHLKDQAAIEVRSDLASSTLIMKICEKCGVAPKRIQTQHSGVHIIVFDSFEDMEVVVKTDWSDSGLVVMKLKQPTYTFQLEDVDMRYGTSDVRTSFKKIGRVYSCRAIPKSIKYRHAGVEKELTVMDGRWEVKLTDLLKKPSAIDKVKIGGRKYKLFLQGGCHLCFARGHFRKECPMRGKGKVLAQGVKSKVKTKKTEKVGKQQETGVAPSAPAPSTPGTALAQDISSLSLTHGPHGKTVGSSDVTLPNEQMEE